VFQAHAVPAWILFAIWPFTRLVHAWNIPIAYFRRPPIVYRPPRATAAGRARAPSVANLAASASSEVRVA
jgi:hypothetical protein